MEGLVAFDPAMADGTVEESVSRPRSEGGRCTFEQLFEHGALWFGLCRLGVR